MAAATFIAESRGFDSADSHIYSSWWFTLLWAALTAVSIAWFIKRNIRRADIVALHLSFVIILAGALLTHLTATRGTVHLRKGEPTSTYMMQTDDGTVEGHLPFSITLKDFEIAYHSGTTEAADYTSRFTICDNGSVTDGSVSMNNIFTHGGVRLYQSSYDDDMRGSTLAINADTWGIGVTYTGYTLLFLSLVWMLIAPRGPFRRLLDSPLLRTKGIIAILLLLSAGMQADAARVLPKDVAERFGELNILYNGRICPVETFATDFTKKLYGRQSYDGNTACQVLTGFIFFGDEWSNEPIVRMKHDALRDRLELPEYCSVNTFFNKDMGGYILGPYVEEAYRGANDKFHRDAMAADDRLMMVMELRRGTLLKMFPYKSGDNVTWLAPVERLPATMRKDEMLFVTNVFGILMQDIAEDNYTEVTATIGKMLCYQQKNGGTSLPTKAQTVAERINNSIPFATILFMLNLTLGFVSLFFEMRRMINGKSAKPILRWLCPTMMILSLAALTVCEALRWIIGGRIPMSNGYETMLFVAWLVMVMSLVAARRFHIALTFGFIASGLFLLVSHISQMDPNISHIMPVLNSPLLSVHVSFIMISFALLTLTFVCGLTAIAISAIDRKHDNEEPTERLMLLSRLFLYPALDTLGIGIFVGAIWANVSWGQYWGWDPKEVWALITFMVYAAAAHTQTIPAMNHPRTYHIFMSLAFLTVLMTYFGVNYVLGGMHSYA